MPRIADLSSQQLITARMLETQQRMFKAQIQVTTKKESTTYSGIASHSQRLISMENTVARMNQYLDTNEVLNTRMQSAQTATEGITDKINEFKNHLLKFPTGSNEISSEDVKTTQEWAFQTLKDIQALLNTDVDGQYLFSGSSRSTEPVDLGLTNLEDFQTKYDGKYVTYPTTRNAHLANFEISSDPNATIAADWADFSATDGRISVPSGSSMFTNAQVGTTIEISGTPGGTNDGTYTVKSVGNTTEMANETTEAAIATDATSDTTASILTPFGSTLSSDEYGNLNFTNPDTITAATNGTFAGLSSGDVIEITNHPNSALNGKFRLTANPGASDTTLTVEPAPEITPYGGATLDFNDFGALTIDATQNRITAGTAGSFAGLTAGDFITMEGTASNDAVYEVTAVDGGGDYIDVQLVAGSYIEVEEQQFASETTMDGITADSSNDTSATFTLPNGNTIDSNQYGFINFDATENKITASGVDAFHSVERGDTIEITGHSNPALNGKYYVEEDPLNNNLELVVRPAVNISAPNGTSLNADDIGPLTFDPSSNSFSVDGAHAGALASIPVGQTVTIEGTKFNDGSYKVTANSSGNTITVEMANLTDSGGPVAANIKSENYYAGDTRDQHYNIADHRNVDINLNAIDPGFEKAIRALSIIAQGDFGSAGGLDKNIERIDDALYLLKDAINQPTGGTPPYGAEESGSIEYLQFEIGFIQRRIANTNTSHTNEKAYLQNAVDNIENADMTEAITNLQLEAQALEASYHVFARFQELSLNNYI